MILISSNAQAKVEVSVKSTKDNTQIQLKGQSPWSYDVRREEKKGKSQVFVQFHGVKPADVKDLLKMRDGRIVDSDVGEGLNGDALVTFLLSGKKVGVFDYQTESDGALIFDVYVDEKPKAKKAKVKTVAVNEIDTLIARKLPTKLPAKMTAGHGGRSIASVDSPQLGKQPALLSEQATSEKLKLQYGIFDGGDKNLERFKFDEGKVSEEAMIRSEKNLYLHFPELIVENGYIKTVLDNPENYTVDTQENEENQLVRLMLQMYRGEKYAVVLRTMKFFKGKYTESKYKKTLAFLEADTIYKIWLRDHNRADLEKSLGLYREILEHYPDESSRYRTTYLIGLSYRGVGNHLGALQTFQTEIKKHPETPYYWPMRMVMAESLRALGKYDDAVKELESIENDPKSANFGVEARMRRGDVYFAQKKYQEAIKEYQEARAKHPDKWEESPNAFFNTAESYFWLRQYKASMDAYREFLQRFPGHPFGGYGMTRIGEILEIVGAPKQKVAGAYLESFFRYHGTPGAYLAKVHVNFDRFAGMKQKEMDAVLKEVDAEMPTKDLPEVDIFVLLAKSDGFLKRKEFKTSLDMLTHFFQSNTQSPHLNLFKDRIFTNLTEQVENLVHEKEKYIEAISVYLKNKATWLRDSNRVDTKFYVGQAYEKIYLLDDAGQYYRDCVNEIYGWTADSSKRHHIFENLPTADALQLRLARVSADKDDFNKAAEYLNNIKNTKGLKEGEQIERSLILARVADKQERFDVAEIALKDLIDHWQSQPGKLATPWLRLAETSLKLGKKDQALLYVQKILNAAEDAPALVPTDVVRHALEFAGDVHLKDGKKEKAAQNFKRLLEKYAGNLPTASIRFKLGQIYFDQGNFQEAGKAWAPLKSDTKAALWSKMAQDQLAQAQWQEKYKLYVDRLPAGGTK